MFDCIVDKLVIIEVVLMSAMNIDQAEIQTISDTFPVAYLLDYFSAGIVDSGIVDINFRLFAN